jgi:hypothetical protein
VVPKIPFDRPTVLDEKVESRYIDSKNVAVRRMRQVVGRGIRTPDACCTIYILDERYKRLGKFLPDRFKDSWTEGGRREVVQSVAERSPSHRKVALKHYERTVLSASSRFALTPPISLTQPAKRASQLEKLSHSPSFDHRWPSTPPLTAMPMACF